MIVTPLNPLAPFFAIRSISPPVGRHATRWDNPSMSLGSHSVVILLLGLNYQYIHRVSGGYYTDDVIVLMIIHFHDASRVCVVLLVVMQMMRQLQRYVVKYKIETTVCLTITDIYLGFLQTILTPVIFLDVLKMLEISFSLKEINSST